ncbi:leucine-rich repeat-containing protein kinase family protein [Rhodoferax sp. PAMC 29310]|uniref:leucine-rich repeat-containing protein kinase family protein n=1 Tax=Rhodoferax sp. PAMC 29310 TaxID=2822760 RepID=UPI001B3414B5|nr:leucine-rich repeat-containing protein kinase family protein [Rhodoferax sp. PAMC 29310]
MHTLEQLRAGQLVGTQRLSLACGLTEFPRDIFALADTLEILDLSNNALTELPPDLHRLHRLRVIFCSNNHFTELPTVLGQCPGLTMIGFKANQIREVADAALPAALRWLILTDNQLQALPASIGRCTQLQKLMLAGNQLRTLPLELALCTRLELLRIAANQLTEFPALLFKLPRLTWLAYAGNPFCAELEAAAEPPSTPIAWEALQLQSTLGEGASGVIHQANWQAGDVHEAVAVKVFRGALTSDGMPQCEMAATLRAGHHTSLIPVRGVVSDHPDGVCALVLALIDPDFAVLAGPPSLDSCTRDVYAPGLRLDWSQLTDTALSIASAASHLHAQGLMHGDLYGHNILHNGQGGALLGDFGAASWVAQADTAHAHALQRLEVRAFGCLLEELLAHSAPEMDEAPGWESLRLLAGRCLSDNVVARPLFAEIEHALMEAQNVYLDPVVAA